MVLRINIFQYNRFMFRQQLLFVRKIEPIIFMPSAMADRQTSKLKSCGIRVLKFDSITSNIHFGILNRFLAVIILYNSYITSFEKILYS